MPVVQGCWVRRPIWRFLMWGQEEFELGEARAGVVAAGAARHWRLRRQRHYVGAFHMLKVDPSPCIHHPLPGWLGQLWRSTLSIKAAIAFE